MADRSEAPDVIDFSGAPDVVSFGEAPDVVSFEGAGGVAPLKAPGAASTRSSPGALDAITDAIRGTPIDTYLSTAGKAVTEIPEYMGEGQHAAVQSMGERLGRVGQRRTAPWEDFGRYAEETGQGLLDIPMMGMDALTFLTRPIFAPVEKGIEGITGGVVSPEAAGQALMALGPKGGGPKPVPRGAKAPQTPPAPPPPSGPPTLRRGGPPAPASVTYATPPPMGAAAPPAPATPLMPLPPGGPVTTSTWPVGAQSPGATSLSPPAGSPPSAAGAPPTIGGGGMPPGGGPSPPASPPPGRPTFTGPATNLRPLPPSLLEGSRAAAKKIEQVFSPTTVDDFSQYGEALIRERQGTNLREAERVRASLDEFNAQIRAMDETQQLDFIDYLETRSAGPRTPIVPQLQPIADSLRNVYKTIETKLDNLPATDQMQFIEDYFPHYWDDPNAVAAFMRTRPERGGLAGKEGSGGFTKKREIPTIAEGLANGLRLKGTNPIEATMQYVENAYRFIAQAEVIDRARLAEFVKFHTPGKQPDGWIELKGRFGQKMTVGGTKRAYAPEGFSTVYNNYISKGFTGPGGDLIGGLQKMSSWATGLELGLSGFHAMTMSQEAMVNAFALAFKNTAGMRPIAAAKNIAGAPLTPITDAFIGGKMQRAYKGQPARGPVERLGDAISPTAAKINRMMDLMTRAGGRAIKMEKAYLSSVQENYVQAFKRGTLKTELAADWRDVKGRPVTGTATVVARHLARIMDTFSAPMFQHWIPKLKQGAFYKQMEAWVERNPGAADGDTLAAAREIWDSVDNRYGEMVKDNIFWDNRIKQSAQIALRSYTWTFGAGREIAGGLWDTAKLPYKVTQSLGRTIEGKPALPGPGANLPKPGQRAAMRDMLGTKARGNPKVTQRMAYVLALPLLYALWNGVSQYVFTGEKPRDLHDLMAARTGGRDAATGRPERVVAPGFMKDVFGWSNKGFWGELYAKTATVPRTLLELSLNEDWRGMPIVPGKGVRDPEAPSWAEAIFNHMLDNLGPFGVKQIVRGQKRGSEISPVATFLGFQPTGRFLTDPAGYERMKGRRENNEWRRKSRADRKEQQRYNGPSE